MNSSADIPEIEWDDNLPVMDREQIDMLLMVEDDEDSTSLVRELFDLFESESREKLEHLSEVCERNDAIGLRKIVHFVAGSAGNLGLSRLCGFYRAIERAIDNEDLVRIAHCEAPVREEFDAAREAFRKEFDL